MKKNSFLAVMLTIVAFTAVVCSCSNKSKEPAIPEGTAIGNIAYFTDDAGMVNFIKTDAEGTKTVTTTQYTKIEANEGFLVGYESQEKMELLTLDGSSFAIAAKFETAPIFAVSSEPTDEKVVLTEVPGNGNHLAYSLKTHKNLANAGGIKSVAIPLSNGITIFKNAKGWGFAQSEKEDAVLDELKDIGVVAAKGKFYIWVQSQDFTGLIDETGKGIKPMNAAGFKALKKKGKNLWEKDGISAVEVKAI